MSKPRIAKFRMKENKKDYLSTTVMHWNRIFAGRQIFIMFPGHMKQKGVLNSFLLRLFLGILASHCLSATGQGKGRGTVDHPDFPALAVDVKEYLGVFELRPKNAVYSIRICADVPDDSRPMRIAKQQETGHVFVVLQQINGVDTTNRVFGFYPKHGLQTLFFKRTRSVIKDNSYRQYDVAIWRDLTAAQFDTVVKRAVELSEKRYHMNRFNCYDYALGIFNSVAGVHALPVVHVRFPFIFGRGGSPCSVYKSFKQLIEAGSFWTHLISFGHQVAPISGTRQKRRS